MNKNIPIIILLLLTIILFLGNSEQRLKKADFLSKTIYFPFINSINIIKENIKVKQKNKRLELDLAVQTITINNLENELQKIENININFEIDKTEFVLADVIGLSGNFKERNFVVNKGKKHDIKVDFPVISTDGIIGKIVSVSNNFSVIMPFDHTNFKLGVMTKNTKLQGLLEADIYGNCYMNMVKIGSEINLGDTIVTSNISTIFPKNYPVGVVSQISEAPDKVHINAKISPFTNPASLDQVIILFYEKDKSYETELENNS